MAKDPAALIYIANWLLTTKGMKAHEKGWYMNLILHQFHNEDNSLPSDLEELANICDVRFSEFKLFESSFEQTFKRIFKQKENGRLYNEDAGEIIKARGEFKEQQSKAGKISYLGRVLRKNYTQDENMIRWIVKACQPEELEDLSEGSIKILFEQKKQLYINKDIVKDENIVTDKNLIPQSLQRFKSAFDNDYNLDDKVIAENTFSPENLVTARFEFWNVKELDEAMLSKSYQDVQKHFLNWCRTNRVRIKTAKPPVPVKELSSDETFAKSKTAL